MKYKFIFLFLLFSFVSYAYDRHKPKDTLAIYQHIDTNYIENYHDWLNLRMVGVVRDNKFAMTDNTSKGRLEYGINTNVNLGLGFSFKNIGFEFQYNPPGVNNDDYKYGKSKQIAFSTSANGRKIIYDVYYRYNQGYHTSSNYKIPNDTGFTYAPLYRPDIKNTTAGCDFTYVFNDMDPMDGLPVYLDEATYRPHMGKPLYKIPSPDPEYKSFGYYYATKYSQAFNTFSKRWFIIISH